MKALVLEAYKTLQYKDVPDPVPAEKEVQVRIKSTGICGSDVHGYDGSSGRRIPPVIMGHEASGIIEKIGLGVKHWKEGDRVTFDSTIYDKNDWFARQGLYNLCDHRRVLGVSCKEYKQDGTFADFVVVPEHVLYRIPDNLSFEEAALTEPVSVALHAVNISQAQPGQTAMVVGAGIIGLFIIQVLKAKGFHQLIAVDIAEEKLEIARKAGAEICLNPNIDDISSVTGKLTEFRGIDVIFEAVGVQKTIDLAFENIRKGGTVALVGNITRQIMVPLQQIVTQQIRIQGSCAICGEYPEALQLLADKKLMTDLIISRNVPLKEGALWFDRLYKREKGLLKVILNPWL